MYAGHDDRRSWYSGRLTNPRPDGRPSDRRESFSLESLFRRPLEVTMRNPIRTIVTVGLASGGLALAGGPQSMD